MTESGSVISDAKRWRASRMTPKRADRSYFEINLIRLLLAPADASDGMPTIIGSSLSNLWLMG
jgi:hypothetical protein